MKRIYAIIFLLSILIGAFQPVTPIAELLVQGKSMADLFDLAEIRHDEACPLKDIHTVKDCTCCQYEGLQLLDTDFYPVPVNTVATPAIQISPYGSILSNPLSEGIDYLYYPPVPPPPRSS